MGRQKIEKEAIDSSEPIDPQGVLQIAQEIRERITVCREMARYSGMELLAYLLDVALADVSDRIARHRGLDGQ